MTKILVCDPSHYGIEYQINPWMNTNNPSDHNLAINQWKNLIDLLDKIGVSLSIMDGRIGLPDLVFTANAALLFPDKKVVLSNFKHPERQPEKNCYRDWFISNEYSILEALEDSHNFEGAGDALFKEDNSILFAGHGFRSDFYNWDHLWEGQTVNVKLIDPYFYHLDTCFCPLPNDYALIWHGAFEEIESFKKNGLKLLYVPEEDAKKFACNAVSIDDKVVIPSGCEQTKTLLKEAGFQVFDTDMSQFILAGGACKCLTLKV